MSVNQTGLFQYTLDVPSDDAVENKRLGYRVPRSVLLPPYLMTDPYFMQFMEAVDEVVGPAVDEKIEILRNLRNMWVTDPALENLIAENGVSSDPQMLSNSDWPQFERPITVRQVNALGMNLQSAGLISDDQYQTISRWVGQYWYGKGTQSFIDFINYCLGTSLSVVKLWTQDYVTFVPQGDPSIGTPIWDGGPWYPTSHVQIEAAGGLQTLSPQDLITFFYEIANYNLVLQSVDLTYNMWIVDQLGINEQAAKIIAIGLWANNVIVMSNFARYGASAPPTQNTGANISTSALVPQGAATSDLVLLMAPTSWMIIDGKTIPVYSVPDMVTQTGDQLPTTVMGPPTADPQVGDYQLLCGPVNWLQVPNSSRSTARIPGYSTTPVAKTVSKEQIPTTSIGNGRKYILASPDGFADLTGTGFVTPYWNN